MFFFCFWKRGFLRARILHTSVIWRFARANVNAKLAAPQLSTLEQKYDPGCKRPVSFFLFLFHLRVKTSRILRRCLNFIKK